VPVPRAVQRTLLLRSGNVCVTRAGTAPDPDRIHWTPLQQRCGCVTDWGWKLNSADPQTFIAWCMNAIDANCPMHSPLPGDNGPLTGQGVTQFSSSDDGATFYARLAAGDDVALGRHLTDELRHVIGLRASDDADDVLAEAPAVYAQRVRDLGFDPADAWTEQRLTDIVLNRGQSEMPHILAQLSTAES
jgi:hypothetical protein